MRCARGALIVWALAFGTAPSRSERSRPAHVRMAASAADFASVPLGHAFVMRKPLAKVIAKRCASCGSDIFLHGRAEVSDEQLLTVLNVISEDKASAIVPGELLVGGFKAALGECKRQPQAVAVNCAGTKLHNFLPATREPFDTLRRDGRVLDLEWDDSEDFVLPLADIANALTWMRAHVHSGRVAVVNCAQGKSRSGAMATAYLMATRDLGVDEALAMVRAQRPFVQPNATFLRRLRELEGEIRATWRAK